MERAQATEPRRALTGRLLAAAAAVAFTLAVSGCNTTEGFGKDVKSVGKGIEEEAAEAKD